MRLTHTLLALMICVPVAAQQRDTTKKGPPAMGHGMAPGAMPGGGMGMEGMMGGMMGHMMQTMGPMTRTMASSPAHLLMHKDVLHLTDQQAAKLTALRDAAQAAHDAAMTAMRTQGEAMATAMSVATPDTTQLKAHFQAAQAAMAQAHWVMLSAAAQARALLTETQPARVDGWADVMEHMMPTMGPGAPGGPDMMMAPRRDPGH